MVRVEAKRARRGSDALPLPRGAGVKAASRRLKSSSPSCRRVRPGHRSDVSFNSSPGAPERARDRHRRRRGGTSAQHPESATLAKTSCPPKQNLPVRCGDRRALFQAVLTCACDTIRFAHARAAGLARHGRKAMAASPSNHRAPSGHRRRWRLSRPPEPRKDPIRATPGLAAPWKTFRPSPAVSVRFSKR
jgi:hypothetical protein